MDLAAAMNELTVFIATRCLIGEEMRRRVSGDVARLYHDLEGGMNLVAFFNPHLPLPAFRRRDRARAAIQRLIGAVIAERRARGVEGEDFLQTLMGAWTGLLLLEHAEYLPPVLAEQRAVLGEGGAMDPESLRRLAVLERCIKEAEPLIMLMRRVVRDFAHAGYRVPAGDMAMVSPAAGHGLAEVFRDPDRYDPDRFGLERREDRRAKHAQIGSGGGHHRCIGATFAQQQIKVIWSVLFQRIELTLARRGHEPDYSTFVVGPRAPCVVRYRRRRRARVSAPALVGRTP